LSNIILVKFNLAVKNCGTNIKDWQVKILNILIFGILITTNVYAGGVYGTLYNKSDLVSPKGNFEAEQNKKKLDAKKEALWNAERAGEKRAADKKFEEEQRRSRR
jgi:hypothetical protein